MIESWLHVTTAFGITAPLVLVALVGVFVRSAGLVDQHFIHNASRLVFNVSLPCLLFTLVLDAEWGNGKSSQLVALSLSHTVVLVLLACFAARYVVDKKADRGVFVQGAFRSNMGIISLALVNSAYGTQGLALAVVPITLNTLLYNVTAIYLLSSNKGQETSHSRKKELLKIVRNPLILAIAAGLVANAVGFQLPRVVAQSADLLAQLALPLALLCVGASLKVTALTRPDRVAVWASMGKLVFSPLLMIAVAYGLFEVEGISLGILLFMASAPAATASFAMVVGFGGNAVLTAQIIALTTVAGAFTIGIWTFILSIWGLI